MKKLLQELKEKGERLLRPGCVDIAVGVGTCGLGNGSGELLEAIRAHVSSNTLAMQVRGVGCFGFCANEPLVNVYIPDLPLLILDKVTIEDIPWIFSSIEKKSFPPDRVLCKITEWDHLGSSFSYGHGFEDIPEWNEINYFKAQKKIVLRHAGLIDPTSLEEYLAVGGYSAFSRLYGI